MIMGVSGPSLLIESADSMIIEKERREGEREGGRERERERERETQCTSCIMKFGCCWWGSA